jgi:hypothetical protein
LCLIIKPATDLPEVSMLIDAAMGWVKGNCPDPKLRADLRRKMKDALQRRIDCWFGIGPVLTRERVPYLIHCYAGELFIFQMTPEQSAAFLPRPNALGSSLDQQTPGSNRRAEQILISLSDMEVDRPVMTPNDPVTGTVQYEVVGELPAAYCLRLDYQLGLPSDTSWFCPEQILSGSGRIRFIFNRLADSKWPFVQTHQGPAALFLRVFTHPAPDETATRRPISNTCGTLVQVSRGSMNRSA